MDHFYTGPTSGNLANIPQALTLRRQWVLWRGEDRIDQTTGKVKLNKIPIDPQTLRNADTTDPLTWGTFDECVAALQTALEEWERDDPAAYRGGGIGYVFDASDPYVGIDLDGCLDTTTGAMAPWAQAYVEALASYTEITPSGTGLHVIVEGTLPPKGRRKGAVEMYAYARFFTMTGWHHMDTPHTIESRAPQLAAMWCELFGATIGETVWLVDTHGTLTNNDKKPWAIVSIELSPEGEPYALFAETATGWPLIRCEVGVLVQTAPAAPAMSDDLIEQHMMRAGNKEKVTRLGAGNWHPEYASQSEADLAFCILLAFWTQDPVQIDRLFRDSRLLRPKWDEKRGTQTYGELTIAEALARCTEHYRPAGIQSTPSNPFALPVQGVAPAATAPHGNGSTPAPAPARWVAQSTIPTLKITDLADMLTRTYPTPKWLIKDLIPEGLIFFIGSPKSSKTYLGYSLALSLSYEAQRGGEWLGHYPLLQEGPVVYVTLEDDEADSRLRIAELAPSLTTIARERLLFVHGHEFPRFDEGLVDVLDTQIIQRYHPVLIVLDPISYLYSPIKKSGDQFSEVRDMLLPLRWLGRRHHCTIAGVDHRRKKSNDDIDIFETQYGSVSKGAIADAMFVIVRDNTEITLHARIRKGSDQTLTLGFEFDALGNAVWTWKGATDGILGQGQYGDLRQKVLNALSGSVGVPLSITDLMLGLNIPDSKQTRHSISQILYRAQKSGEIQKTTRNQYMWAGGI